MVATYSDLNEGQALTKSSWKGNGCNVEGFRASSDKVGASTLITVASLRRLIQKARR
jgi:hypothetical protein